MSIKDRLKAFIIETGLNQTKFEKSWGVSNGYINNIKKSISDDKLELLSKAFPQVDTVWIKMGIDAKKKEKLYKAPTIVSKVSEQLTRYTPKVVVVDPNDNELITMVAHKAAAGYLNGYEDAEYLEKLPTISLPGYRQGAHRAFEIRGHSMPPLHSGSYSVGKYEESLKDIKDRHTYIIVSKNDGIVLKRVINIESEEKLILISDNPNKKEYPNYTMDYQDVAEIWYWRCAVIYSLPDPEDLYSRINELETKSTLAEERLNQITGQLNRLLK